MDRIVLCLIPGLDLRHIDPDRTPYIASLLAGCPWAKVRTVPSPEQLSTIITGQHPHHHEIWQTRVAGPPERSASDRVVDSLPDFVTIAGQAALHQCFGCCDVPTIAPRRRRAFEFRRLKFRGRADAHKLRDQLGAVRSVVDVVGAERFRYHFSDRLHDAAKLGDIARQAAPGIDLVQFHALDMIGHWQINTPAKLDYYYGRVDAFVRDMHRACEDSGVPMALMSDHGQEPVHSSIDLPREIRRLDVPADEFAYFVQPVMARFWCFSERARAVIVQMLGQIPHGNVLSYRDLHELDVKFEDAAFGEIYFIPDPSYLLFPHDFYHPLVNFVFGLKDAQQRARMRDPRHVAYHGYLPHHPSEAGFLALLSGARRADADQIHLVDVMPSLLALIGVETPAWMDGCARFAAA